MVPDMLDLVLAAVVQPTTIFPSKYIRDKANATPSRAKHSKDDDSSSEGEDATPTRRRSKKNKMDLIYISIFFSDILNTSYWLVRKK